MQSDSWLQQTWQTRTYTHVCVFLMDACVHMCIVHKNTTACALNYRNPLTLCESHPHKNFKKPVHKELPPQTTTTAAEL